MKWILSIWLRLKYKDSTLLIINNIDATLETLSLHLIFLILPGGTIIYLAGQNMGAINPFLVPHLSHQSPKLKD